MSTLLGAIAKAAIPVQDDQKAINIALSELGIAWDPKSDMVYEKSTRRGRGTVESLADDDEEFVVTLLPHKTFTRRCDITPLSNDTVVAHCTCYCHVPKEKRMEVWMKESDLWWEND